MEEGNQEEEFKGGFKDEAFYENIQAPKFVDLRASDRHKPQHDDRYWFCLRAGCDQKHEEEMDSETIYKNFVLRVMAARSPNVKLRRALLRENNSKNLKCPLTVPAKSSKSRISKLAMISSINQKVVESKAKVRTLHKASATPNAKVKQSSVQAKALTTPRQKKPLSNVDAFRSVRNPKSTTTAMPKSNKSVAKALVFGSPRKEVKIKTSVELRSSVKMLCSGMKKLEIARGKKQLPPLEAAKKQLKGREVKSRVYDSLHSQNRKRKEAEPSNCIKEDKKERDMEQCLHPVAHQHAENDSSNRELDAKPATESSDVCFKAVKLKSDDSSNREQECLISDQNSAETLSESSISVMTSLSGSSKAGMEIIEVGEPKGKTEPSQEKETVREVIENDDTENANRDSSHNGSDISVVNDQEEKIKLTPEKEITLEVSKNDDKENALTCDENVNDGEILEGDDKENCSASDENRQPNLSHNLAEKKKKVLRKHEKSKSIQKVSEVTRKTPKGNCDGNLAASHVRCRKPKPTTPKPFRFRTDERGILKEATSEKKLHHVPLGEIAVGMLSDQYPVGASGMGISKRQSQMKSSAQRDVISALKNRKPVASKLQNIQEKVTKASEPSMRKTKPLLVKQLARPRGKSTASLMKHNQLGMDENSTKVQTLNQPSDCSASEATKAPPRATPRWSSQGRIAATTAKEPNSRKAAKEL